MSTIKVDAHELMRVSSQILQHQGVPPADADFVAESLVAADLRGIHSHGVLRLARYVRELRVHITNPRPEIRITAEGSAYARVDGGGGLGQLVGRYAMQVCIRKARSAGTATVTACRSRHFGASGFYALMALECDFVGIAMTVASPRLAPTGGVRPLFGNNPLAMAVPGGTDFPLLVDFAMGQTGAGRLELAAANGESIPEGLACDPEGRPTTDPTVALEGSIAPIGGHKGYGLTLLIEILAGLLGGSPYFGIERARVGEHLRTRGIGHFFMVLDPSRFMPLAQFQQAVAEMVARIKASPRREDVEEILVPGELEQRRRREGLRAGIAMAASTMESLGALAAECGARFH